MDSIKSTTNGLYNDSFINILVELYFGIINLILYVVIVKAVTTQIQNFYETRLKLNTFDKYSLFLMLSYLLFALNFALQAFYFDHVSMLYNLLYFE